MPRGRIDTGRTGRMETFNSVALSTTFSSIEEEEMMDRPWWSSNFDLEQPHGESTKVAYEALCNAMTTLLPFHNLFVYQPTHLDRFEPKTHRHFESRTQQWSRWNEAGGSATWCLCFELRLPGRVVRVLVFACDEGFIFDE